GVTAVKIGQRLVLLLAGDAPRVPEVHDHDLAGEVARPDAAAVEGREVDGRRVGAEQVALVRVGARVGPDLGREDDREHGDDEPGGERDPAGAVFHTGTFSGTGVGGATGAGSSTRRVRRRNEGESATAVPMAMTPPPAHSHSIIGFTATPMMTRPCSLGDEMSVR